MGVSNSHHDQILVFIIKKLSLYIGPKYLHLLTRSSDVWCLFLTKELIW